MRLFFVIGLVMIAYGSGAQDTTVTHRFRDRTEHSTDVWVGYNFQGNWSDKTGATTLKYLEIGIGKGRYMYSRHGVAGAGIYLSEEILLNGNKTIFGTKLGCFLHSLLGIGMSIVYYTNFEKGNLNVRPELGFGVGRFGIVAGYNIPTIRNKSMPELRMQNAQLTIRAGFGIKKKEAKFDRLI